MTLAAETVLGALLIDSGSYWRIAEIVCAEDFPPEYRPLFTKIATAAKAGETYDAVTAWEDGFENAIDLAKSTASTANIAGWARRVAEASETTRIREAGRRIALCDTYVDAQALLAAVRPEQAAQVKTVSDGLTEFVETLQARYDADGTVTGVPTGISGLDDLTSGWQPGNLIVLVGETSMGKSALAMQMALSAAAHCKKVNKSVLYFSLEMTAGELTERAVANLADFPMAWMTHPKDAPEYAMTHVQRGSAAFNDLPIMFDDRCGLTLEQISSRTLQLHMQKPLGLVVVDYMHIMGRPRRNDVAELGGIAAGLKNLSKTVGAPVLALHQLNRGNIGKRPTLGDIRASGEIAEAANTVLAIHRSEVANPGFAALHGYAEVLVLKQRQGRRDVRAWAKSMLGNMRFDSCEAPEGYDETIREDQPAGGAGQSGSVRSIQSRNGPRSQPVPMARLGGGS